MKGSCYSLCLPPRACDPHLRAELLRHVMALKMRVVAAGDAAHFSRQKTRETKPLVLISMSPDFKAAFMAWRTQSESTLPTRVNMRQRAYFMVPTPFRAIFCHFIHVLQVLRVERSFLRGVMRFWEQITREMQQGRNKASRWNSERDRLREIIVQVARRACVTLAVRSLTRHSGGGGGGKYEY